MKLADILALMHGMASSKIAVLEMPGLKLVSAQERPSASAAASSHSPSPTVEQAMQQAAMARQAAVENRLNSLQQKTAELRRKAAGGHAPQHIGALVNEVYKEAVKTPQRAKSPKTS